MYDRLTKIARAPVNRAAMPPAPQTDPCQSSNFVYDGNPFTAGANAVGRLAYSFTGDLPFNGLGSGGTACPVMVDTQRNNTVYEQIYEDYSYTAAGQMSGKGLHLTMNSNFGGNVPATQTLQWKIGMTYNSDGNMLSMKYPDAADGNGTVYYQGHTITYGYDALGRPNTYSIDSIPARQGYVSDYDNYNGITSVAYNAANQPVQTNFTYHGVGYAENRSYNALNQLTNLGGIPYTYSATQNNGQVTGAENVTYTYDALKRLTAATAAGANPWTQGYAYDGFGNMYQMGASGISANSFLVNVDSSTNRIVGLCYDANGNQPPLCQAGMFDVANRLTGLGPLPADVYLYNPANKRVAVVHADGTETVYLYGPGGEKLVSINLLNGAPANPPMVNNFYFAGRFIQKDQVVMFVDRLGSVVSHYLGVGVGNETQPYYLPYGQDLNGTAEDREKFATYTRDFSTKLDYADQRYYNSIYGRFSSPDPYKASGGPSDPGSWNRYSYTRNDPVNRRDVSGLQDTDTSIDVVAEIDGDLNYIDPFPSGGGGGGSAAQQAVSTTGVTFATASGAFQRAAKSISKRKFKKPCKDDFAALGTSAGVVQTDAANLDIENGSGSMVLEASLWANTAVAAAAAMQYGSLTIGQYQSQHPGTVAQAQLNGNTIYVNASLIDPTNIFQNLGVVLHEVLHNVTGLTDDAIQTAFGLSTRQVSDNITQKLIKDCF